MKRFLTSAKDGTNIHEAFRSLTQVIWANFKVVRIKLNK